MAIPPWCYYKHPRDTLDFHSGDRLGKSWILLAESSRGGSSVQRTQWYVCSTESNLIDYMLTRSRLQLVRDMICPIVSSHLMVETFKWNMQ